MSEIQTNDMKLSRHERLSRLNETFVDLASIDERQLQNIDEILQKIIDKSRDILNADLIEFYEYYQSQNRFRLPQIKSGEYLVERVKRDAIFEDDVMHALINEHKPFFIETSDQVPKPFNKEYFVDRDGVPIERFYVREKIESLAVIPIRAGNENVGLMFANFRSAKTFDDEFREIIRLFAIQTAIVIRNARLYHQLLMRQRAFIDVGVTLNSQIRQADREFVFKTIYNEAKNKLGMENLSLSLYDDEKDEISFKFAYFPDNSGDVNQASLLKNRKGDEGKTGWVIQEKHPLLIRSGKELKELNFSSKFYNENDPDAKYSWLGVPMRLGDKACGVVATSILPLTLSRKCPFGLQNQTATSWI